MLRFGGTSAVSSITPASRYQRLLTAVAAVAATTVTLLGVPTSAHAETYVSPEDQAAVLDLKNRFIEYDTAFNPISDGLVDRHDVAVKGEREDNPDRENPNGSWRSIRINSWFFELDVADGPLDGLVDRDDVDVWLLRADRRYDQPSFDPFNGRRFDIKRIDQRDRETIDGLLQNFSAIDGIYGPSDGVIDRHDLVIAALPPHWGTRLGTTALLHFYEMDAAAGGSLFDGKVATRDIEAFLARA